MKAEMRKTASRAVIDPARIIERLKYKYSIPRQPLRSDPVSVLVQTILSQNTSDTNSGRAFRILLDRFQSWENVSDADTETITGCIRSGGLGKIKAGRIKQVLKEIAGRRGRLELDFLSQLSLPDAEGWLTNLPGVGPKTARCVLLFSLGMPALPVDTHILRISRRLGLIGAVTSATEAHRLLQNRVAPDCVFDFHLIMIEHGRKTCLARHPRCHECPLADICISSVFWL
jgi:endonuclease-3